MDPDLREIFKEGSKEIGFPLSNQQIDLFLIYLSELKRWNKKTNLTSIIDDKEIIVKHFLDSLCCFKAFEMAPELNIMDIGSGAGFPGIPLKIFAPALNIFLVEASAKKTSFLFYISNRLKAEAKIINERFEKISDDRLSGKIDILMTRGLPKSGLIEMNNYYEMEGKDILAKGIGVLKKDGLIIFFKGKEEINPSFEIKDIGKIERIIEYRLPILGHERKLVLVRPGN